MKAAWGLWFLVAVAGLAQAQGKGSYVGTVKVNSVDQSRTNKDDRIAFVAEIKLTVPITDGQVGGSVMAEANDVDKPSAVANVTSYEYSGSDTDTYGRYTRFDCKLAAPATIPMTTQGVLNVDFPKRTHSMFFGLVGTKPLDLSCVNSRTGPYKDKRAFGASIGTNDPSDLPYKELPADPAKPAAKHRLVPRESRRAVTIDQDWSFALQR